MVFPKLPRPLFGVVLVCLAASLALADEADLCKRFSSFDFDRDGRAEIEGLRLLATAGSNTHPLVVTLVEQRLVDKLDDAEDLVPKLKRHAQDLANERLAAWVVAVKVAGSKNKQDGLSVLALRAFLQAVAKDNSQLAGVVLVGSFPEASLVRRHFRIQEKELELKKEKRGEQRYITVMTKAIARRADIVLADLDGPWDKLYHKRVMKLSSLTAIVAPRTVVKGIDGRGGRAKVTLSEGNWEITEEDFSDFFFLDDCRFVATPKGKGLEVELIAESNPECAESDKKMANPIARPELIVSRISARGVAVQPNPAIVDACDHRLLDSKGRPQALHFKNKRKVPKSSELWVEDQIFERKLLAEYFDRNHSFRTAGLPKNQFLPASIVSKDFGSKYAMLCAGLPKLWKANSGGKRDARKATLLDFVSWMEQPAVLRAIVAHSDPDSSGFAKVSGAALETSLGTSWWWSTEDTGQRRKVVLRPGFPKKTGKVTYGVVRSLYETQRPPTPTFYLHWGCNAISPKGWDKLGFDEAGYSRFNTAETLLFLGGGMALIGRSKVFNDGPKHYPRALGQGQRFGEPWKQSFYDDAQDAAVATAPTSPEKKDRGPRRKKAYFWSVLGDWTLRLVPGK